MIEVRTPEHEELGRGVRKFLEQRSPLSEVRRLADSGGYDTGVWAQMAKELGLQAMSIPEEVGGMGFGALELGLVVTELGRALYSGPFFASVCLATPVLIAADPSAETALLAAIAEGTRVATLAYRESGGSWDGSRPQTRWRRAGDRVLVTGEKTLVVNGGDADLLVVTAADDAGAVAVLLVDSTAEGVEVDVLPTLDQTRSLAAIRLTNAPAHLLGDPAKGGAALRRGLQEAAILLAAEQLGGAERCLEMAVEYARTREQFGRAIGSFQAVKHRCVDMLVDVETARSAVLLGLGAMAAGEDLAEVSSLALAQCSEVYTRVAEANISVHGGIGFTWEHDAHLFLKRARGSAVVLGGVAEHRELVARAMGL